MEDHVYKALVEDDEIALEALLELTKPSGELTNSLQDPLKEAASKDDFELFKSVYVWLSQAEITSDRLDRALDATSDFEIAEMLTTLGANPHRSYSMDLPRMAFTYLDHRQTRYPFLSIGYEDYKKSRHPRFGVQNPEDVRDLFWTAMVISRRSAYSARDQFRDFFEHGFRTDEEPVWCANRYGQSFNLLPDGRMIEIGGAHEDSYDPDFHIYNDIFCHEPDGTIRILCYPESEFPSIDFHSATLIGNDIYIIGRLGFAKQRQPGITPVYVLDTTTFKITEFKTYGDNPGYIYKHSAKLVSESKIRVWGGKVIQTEIKNDQALNGCFELNLKTGQWTKADDQT